MHDLVLTPPVATGLFLIAALSGMQYRRVWKAEGPRWQLWLFGMLAGGLLLLLGFVPMKTP